MTPAEVLRTFVVRTVVRGILGLAVALYVLAGVLLVLHVLRQGTEGLEQAVPAWLTLAAGNASGALITLLLNSKAEPAASADVVSSDVYLEDAPAP